jgi:dipeptidase
MEIIGKGEYELGAVWVAFRLPEGSVSAHANQARITTFPLNDPENCLYAVDVISFAKKIGLYPAEASDNTFSFSDIYDPVTFGGARFCDARVWSVFSSLLGPEWSNQYLDYAQGYNLTNRMPLYVFPTQKLTIQDVSALMRNHYENTPLDMTGKQFSDVGSYTNSIYRAHPLTWSSTVNPNTLTTDSVTYNYVHERPIATPQTGWNFIAQTRPNMPVGLQGIIWFGVDDVSTTVRTPVYGSATKVPTAFAGAGAQDGVVPPMMTFNWDSAFYVFNVVANFAYSRWDLISRDLIPIIQSTEQDLIQSVKDIDQSALTLLSSGSPTKDIIDFVSQQGVQVGAMLMKKWQGVFGQLFVKYRDGYVITADAMSTSCGCAPVSAGYPQQWYDRIVKDTGKHYLQPDESESEQALKLKNKGFAPVPKTQLKALQ